MNEFTIIKEHGPAPTPLTADVLAKARAELLTEIRATTPATSPGTTHSAAPAASHTASRPPVRLKRRAVIIAATVAAAAVATGVIATSGTDAPLPTPPVDTVPVLVEFHMPALPPELNPVPKGVRPPSFTGEKGWIAAVYLDTVDRRGYRGELSDIYVIAHSDRPGSRGDERRDTTYDGKPAVIEKVDQEEPGFRSVSLSWERSPGQWITLTGSGDFAAERVVRSLADTLVDTNKRLSLEISVAPAGWELLGFKGAAPDGAGAVTTLQDPRNPDRNIYVSTMLGLEPNYGRVVEGGPRETIPISVHGRHGDLVLIPGKQWMLQAPLPDGRAFQLQVPADFTQQQVLELAEGVS